LLCLAQEEPKKDTTQKISEHQTGAVKTSADQDKLAADIQQLKIEQTQEKVIKLLDECEVIMDEATDNLLEYNTGGDTIAAQTEVIEKIFEAAKQKQQKGEGQPQPGAEGMMEMMKRMMGEGSEGDEKKPGNKPGNKPGMGSTGDSDSANTASGGGANGQKSEERRVPKASGTATQDFPEEYRQALDAYNRALTK
jgi:hypothetical protein